ncbi:MAG: alkaline phosphatase family protein [Blastocatellia bacterium]|nr:alkaline phosphatase family protein [Blastocatellia bacterium]
MRLQRGTTFSRIWFWTFLLVLTEFGIASPKAIKDLKPTVILLSLDGFRYDYLDKYPAEHLNRLVRAGVRAKWMIPAYPSLTFPNHYSVATGLYPVNHGIVGNTMYDAEFETTFSLSKREEVGDSRWWQGEPIWVTAEKQGLRTGAFFFPGTEAEIGGKRPTFWKTYDGKIPNEARVDQILAWLDLPQAERPRLFTLYFSDVDDAGHNFSPDSPEVAQAIANVDAAVGKLLDGLKARKIHKKVNLIIVSDHGMATVNPENKIVLDDHFDATMAEQIVWGGQLTGIFPKAGAEAAIDQALKARPISHATCYRKTEIPARFHYQNNRRIPPLICIADEGWTLTSRKRHEKDKNKISTHSLGAHGYDNQLPSMRAIFIAHGEAFGKGKIVEPFENVNVYNIMTKILNLTPAKNDGTFDAARQVLSRPFRRNLPR